MDKNRTQILLAKRQTFFGSDFGIVDSKDQLQMRITCETRLARKTFKMFDAKDALIRIFEMDATKILRLSRLPRCWLEDADGNRLGAIEFGSMAMTYDLIGNDGRQIFSMSLETLGGIMEKLQKVALKKCKLVVFDKTFPPAVLLGIVAAIDTGLV